MRRSSGSNIESLLLLCCLVGAVSFFCLSIAISKLLFAGSVIEVAALKEEEKKIDLQLAQMESTLDSLTTILSSLRSELLQSKKPAGTNQYSQSERMRLEESKNLIERELMRMERERDLLAAAISEESAKMASRSEVQVAKDMAETRRKKEELDHKIQARESELAKYKMPDIAGESIESLRKIYEDKIKKVEVLANKINELKLKVLTSGTEKYRNPIYFDCRGNVIKIYPSARVLALSEAKNIDLSSITINHDIIVLYVRPDGYDTFYALHEKVEALNKPLCYEPLAASQNIEMLLGN